MVFFGKLAFLWAIIVSSGRCSPNMIVARCSFAGHFVDQPIRGLMPSNAIAADIPQILASLPAAAPQPPSALADPDALLADTIARHRDDPDFVTALARGLAVLLTLSDKKRRMSIAQVSHRTGIPRAAARRSLHTLATLGFVAVDEARRFYLRPRVLSFSPRLPVGVTARHARAACPRSPGRSAARGLLARNPRRGRDRLHRALGVVTHHVAELSTSDAACPPTARPSGTSCSRICRPKG